MLKELLKTSHVPNLGRKIWWLRIPPPWHTACISIMSQSSPSYTVPTLSLESFKPQTLDLHRRELFVATNHWRLRDAHVATPKGLPHQDFNHYTRYVRMQNTGPFFYHPSNETFELLQGHLLIMVQVLSDWTNWTNSAGQEDPRRHRMKDQARCHYHSLLSAPANVSTHPQLLDTDTVNDARMCKHVVFQTALRVHCQTGGTDPMCQIAVLYGW